MAWKAYLSNKPCKYFKFFPYFADAPVYSLLESVIDALITSLLLLWPETKHDDTAIWTIVSVAIVFSIIIYFFYLFNS